jgi:hypothetical protein
MSLRSYIKRNGDYPKALNNEIITKKVIQLDALQSFLLVTYETNRIINIYLGGHDKWCIYSHLVKDDNNEIKEMGYITKIRYDKACSLNHRLTRGGDMTQLISFLIQYIYNTYPNVKEMTYNDLSTRSCDNDTDVSLADHLNRLYRLKTLLKE